ncbi:hypothetical protein YDYSG_48690 [Paenibacillus tyrfis]|uniref:hypothetical protein n=1 Tax=Paenibacillus tyrfis TaxID=1501230 RepID=UPI002490671C|nr:hypothetical protein [Paenibacillus tyrfis]GLI08837.1 hypothetical protein YDYSG_48690 [Paenibacillus tyrfis]
MEESDFISYVGDYRVHDSTIVKIQDNGQELVITLHGMEGENLTLYLRDVLTINMHEAEGMMLYAISEYKYPAPYRKFIFANWKDNDDAFLEVIAKDLVLEPELTNPLEG